MAPSFQEVRCPDELKAGRKAHAAGRAGDEDLAVLERLSQRFERGSLELGELVQQQHAPVGKRRFAGPEPRPAADDGRGRGAVMWCAKRRLSHERMIRVDETRDRVNPSHL